MKSLSISELIFNNIPLEPPEIFFKLIKMVLKFIEYRRIFKNSLWKKKKE